MSSKRFAWRRREPRAGELHFEPAEALWLLSSFCSVYQRSFDAELLAKECVPPVAAADLARLADLIGLTAEAIAIDAHGLTKLRAPVAVQLGGEEPAPPDPDAAAAARPGWLIVLSVQADNALVAGPGDRSPRTMPLATVVAR